MSFFFFLIYCVFWLCWGIVAVWAFLQLQWVGTAPCCSVWASQCHSFSCCGTWTLGHTGFSSCGSQTLEYGAQQLWHTSLVAPRHVESSRTRNRTHDSYIGRQTVYHWATREAPVLIICQFITHGWILILSRVKLINVFSLLPQKINYFCLDIKCLK